MSVIQKILGKRTRAQAPAQIVAEPVLHEPLVFETQASREECEQAIAGRHFYHSFDLSNGLHIAGDWDASIGRDLYGFPDLKGKRVLEVGPASGWFSFFFEKMGADVTVVETRGYGDFDVFGEHSYTGARGRKPDRIVHGEPLWDGPVSPSFWAMHGLLNSKVKFVNGRIYEVGPDMFSQPFDLIVIGALLLHLRDPAGALRALRSVCKPDGLCIATTTTWEDRDHEPEPIVCLPYTSIDRISWWLPNKAAYLQWFRAAGFASVDVEQVIDYVPDRETRNQNDVVMNNPMRLRVAHARP